MKSIWQEGRLFRIWIALGKQKCYNENTGRVYTAARSPDAQRNKMSGRKPPEMAEAMGRCGRGKRGARYPDDIRDNISY